MTEVLVLRLIAISIRRLSVRHILVNNSADIASSIVFTVGNFYQLSCVSEDSAGKLAPRVIATGCVCILQLNSVVGCFQFEYLLVERLP